MLLWTIQLINTFTTSSRPGGDTNDMSELPWGVIIILGVGLSGTAYIIYYILKLAAEEMKDESPRH